MHAVLLCCCGAAALAGLGPLGPVWARVGLVWLLPLLLRLSAPSGRFSGPSGPSCCWALGLGPSSGARSLALLSLSVPMRGGRCRSEVGSRFLCFVVGSRFLWLLFLWWALVFFDLSVFKD